MYNKVPTLIYQPKKKKSDSYISKKMSLKDKISIYKQISSTFNKKQWFAIVDRIRMFFWPRAVLEIELGHPFVRGSEEGVNALSRQNRKRNYVLFLLCMALNNIFGHMNFSI